VPDGKTVTDLLQHRDHMLLPTSNIKQAVETFDQTEAEALAVVDSYLDRRVIGLVTEAYALRRYSAELEVRQRELLGEG
jgi:CIC family chloride channel protein